MPDSAPRPDNCPRCGCAPLAELEAMLLAEGWGVKAASSAARRLAELEKHGLVERCSQHERNWRLTADGWRQLVMEVMEA